MTISRVKLAGWGVGEKLESGQITQVDLNTTYALDKRSGQTDSLASLVSLAVGGRLVSLVQTGADADGTYLIANGQVIRILTLGANRSYTLSATGAADGDLMSVEADSSVVQYVNVIDGPSAATLTRVGYNGAAFAASFRFDGTNWKLVSYVPTGLYADAYTANGTWIRPSFVSRVLLLGVGGGGGGGGGGGHGLGTNGRGGGGGGGASMGITSVVVAANQTVTVGSAGAAGTAGITGNNGGDGGDGGDTTFGTLATFRGAQGGCGGAHGDNASLYAPGGGQVRGGGYINPRRSTAPTDLPLPGFGGWGTDTAPNTALRTGGSTPMATGASPGANTSTAPGGAGGGASDYPSSAPGAGGASSTGVGVAGSAGSAGTLGAGGGGGGGTWTSGGASGGAGGAGGTGALVVIYAR